MRLLSPITLLFIFLSGHAALADTIVLDNGDRISGTIVKKETDKLIVKTPYAGKISISWKNIKQITTDKPVQVMMRDDTMIKGVIHTDSSGRITLKNAEVPEAITLDLAKVKYVNPSPRLSGNGVSVSGHLNVGVSISSGNTKNQQYHIDTEIIIRSRKNRFTTAATLFRSKENNVETENRSYLGFKYDHFISKKHYIYGTTAFRKDRFKDLKLKSTIGFGYGRQVWESPEKNLSVEGGLSLVNDDFINAADDSYAAGRWAIRYDQKLLRGKTTFFHQHEGLVDLETSNNVSVTSQTGFRFPLMAGLNASTQVNVDWDNSPAPGAKKTDLKYLLNIGYTW